MSGGIVPAQASGPTGNAQKWGNQEIDAYVAKYSPSKANDDLFELPPPPPPPAENIELRYPIKMQGSGSERANWSYDRETQVMTVAITEDGELPKLSLDFQKLLSEPAGKRATLRGWITDNKFPNHPKLGNYSVLWSNFRGFGEIARTSGADWGAPSYSHSWTIPPEEARALSDHLELRVVGRTRSWSPNNDNWIVCGKYERLKEPILFYRTGCFVTGTILEYRVVDDRNDKVIREWSVDLASTRAENEDILRRQAATLNATLPMKIDQITTMVSASATGTTVVLEHEISKTASADRVRTYVGAKVLPAMCSSKLRTLVQRGVTIRLRYHVPKVEQPVDVDLTEGACAR